MKKALILRALALAAMMSPCGGEDIVGECTVEGCGFTIVKNFLIFIKMTDVLTQNNPAELAENGESELKERFETIKKELLEVG